ncbi:MAG: ABC transporter substrate-binding protein, partial [Nitrososphaera sp.]
MNKLWKVLGCSVAVAVAMSAGAQTAGPATGSPVRIGVLTDMSSLFSDIGGQGSVVAARMAI